MTGRLVVVTGTGTEIGKTHVAEALLRAWAARGVRSAGVKPVESGVGQGVSDADRLRAASSFHVKHRGLALAAPLSPHLAAEKEHVRVDLAELAADVAAARREVDILLVELPGALFTPLSASALNADFASMLACDVLLLVAPDRLGVLHDVLAATRAAAARQLPVDGVILVTPPRADASTGTNAAQLARFTQVPALGTLPRASPDELATLPALDVILEAIRLPRRGPAPG